MAKVIISDENASDSGVSSVKIFENEQFGEIRVAGTSDEPLFCLLDVCKVLDLGNTSQVKSRLTDDVITNEVISDSIGRQQEMMFVNEDGLYDVILDSRKPQAKLFRKWVTKEVLPSIRKTGSYSIEQQLPKTYLEALRALVAAEEEKERLALENAEKQRKIEEQTPKVQYFDNLVERNLLTNFRDTAKEIGLKQNQLINLLLENGYLYRDQRNKLKPYAEHVPDYFEIKDYENNGHTGTQTLVTPKGKEAFRLLFGNGLK